MMIPMPSPLHSPVAWKQCAWCRRVLAGDRAVGPPLPALLRGISHGLCACCWDAELGAEARRLAAVGDRARALEIERERQVSWPVGRGDRRAESRAAG
jgi:hypothetical protein